MMEELNGKFLHIVLAKPKKSTMPEKIMINKRFFKIIFAICFTVLTLSYLFIDDGGIQTKTFLDFVFIPVISFVFSWTIFTIITLINFVFYRFEFVKSK